MAWASIHGKDPYSKHVFISLEHQPQKSMQRKGIFVSAVLNSAPILVFDSFHCNPFLVCTKLINQCMIFNALNAPRSESNALSSIFVRISATSFRNHCLHQVKKLMRRISLIECSKFRKKCPLKCVACLKCQ